MLDRRAPPPPVCPAPGGAPEHCGVATLPTALALLLELSHAAEVVPDCRWAAEGLRRAVGEHFNPSPNPSPNPNPNP